MTKNFLTKINYICMIIGSLLVFSSCSSHEHEYSKQWSYDENYHWKDPVCGDTSEKGLKSLHNFVDDKCTLCSYEREHKHTFSNKWSSDEMLHWHASTCGHTGVIDSQEMHNFENEVCIICGYENNHKHEFSSNWTYDEYSHWHAAICEHQSEVSDEEEHIFANGICIRCNYVRPVQDNDEEETIVDGLAFTTIYDKTGPIGYSVSVGNKTNESEIIIPFEYKGLPILEIKDKAFYGCDQLKNVIIPASITKIGFMAFYRCNSLESIEIPDNVLEIGDSTFFGCTSLKEVILPETIQTILYKTFYYCTSLKYVKVPNSVETIGRKVFEGCSSLERITIGSGVKEIGSSAFDGCINLSFVDIVDFASYCKIKFSNLMAMPFCASTKFNTQLCKGEEVVKTLIIPEGVERIVDRAFSYCMSIEELVLPSTLKNFGYTGYSGCGYRVFEGCKNLKRIVFSEGITKIDRESFISCSALQEIKFPSSLQEIDYGAFLGCVSLSSVKFENNIQLIGDNAFKGCTSLTDINYNGTIEEWQGVTKKAYWNSGMGKYTVHCINGTVDK